jgi:hypothetical protein
MKGSVVVVVDMEPETVSDISLLMKSTVILLKPVSNGQTSI